MINQLELNVLKRALSQKNRYCTKIGSSVEAFAEHLVSQGLMFRGGIVNNGASRYFHVTGKGEALVKAHGGAEDMRWLEAAE